MATRVAAFFSTNTGEKFHPVSLTRACSEPGQRILCGAQEIERRARFQNAETPMKALLIATLIALCLPAASRAKTYMLPDDEPVALIALPDAWAADDLDDGIEAVSPDEAVYVAVEAAAAETLPLHRRSRRPKRRPAAKNTTPRRPST